jgi:hypothetical protein
MDVVVTVPKWFGLRQWINEGDAVGTPWSGQLWHFDCGGGRPNIKTGERVYIVCQDRLRGYAPLVRLEWNGHRGSFIRGGNAVAVTLSENVKGFQGWRYRWWEYSKEMPFPNWSV